MSLFVSLRECGPYFDFLIERCELFLSGHCVGLLLKNFQKLKQKSSIHYLRKQREVAPLCPASININWVSGFSTSFFLSFFLVLIQMISSNPNPSLFIRSESGVRPGSGRRQLVASRDLSPPRDAATMCVGGLNFHTYQRVPDFETVCNLAVVW